MEDTRYNCSLNLPYPAIKTQGSNPFYASLLMQEYAGRVSEITAVTQYLYQHLIVEEKAKELAGMLECVAIEEMRHLEMLGTLITLLGGNPQFRSGGRQNRFWRGDFVSYVQNIKRFLENNIAAERHTIAAYKLRYRQIPDEGVRKVIERIILDEEHHIKLFEQALKEYG